MAGAQAGIAVQLTTVGAQLLTRQAQGKRLLPLGQLQHPMAEQRQARFHIAAQLLEIQLRIAPAEAGKLLDQQALAQELDALNIARREVEKQVTDQATRMVEATGPKISSSSSREPGATSVSKVGG